MMSLPGDCGQESLPLANLTSNDPGQCPGVARGDAPIGHQISINGSADLRSIIVGPGGSYVQKITYEQHARPVRPGTLYVYGQGPSGRGSLLLTFQTSNQESHTVKVDGSSPGCYSDPFEDLGDITSVTWSYVD